MIPQSFHPTPGATKNIVAGVTSTNLHLIVGAGSGGPIQVLAYNSGTATVFIRQGPDSSVAATLTTDTPLPPGSLQVFTFNVQTATNDGLWIAAISASASQTVYFTPGSGI